jgi:hypothetical protein
MSWIPGVRSGLSASQPPPEHEIPHQVWSVLGHDRAAAEAWAQAGRDIRLPLLVDDFEDLASLMSAAELVDAYTLVPFPSLLRQQPLPAILGADGSGFPRSDWPYLLRACHEDLHAGWGRGVPNDSYEWFDHVASLAACARMSPEQAVTAFRLNIDPKHVVHLSNQLGSVPDYPGALKILVALRTVS